MYTQLPSGLGHAADENIKTKTKGPLKAGPLNRKKG